MAIYGLAALACVLSLLRRLRPSRGSLDWVPGAWAGGLAPGVIGRVSAGELFQSYGMMSETVEEAREMGSPDRGGLDEPARPPLGPLPIGPPVAAVPTLAGARARRGPGLTVAGIPTARLAVGEASGGSSTGREAAGEGRVDFAIGAGE